MDFASFEGCSSQCMEKLAPGPFSADVNLRWMLGLLIPTASLTAIQRILFALFTPPPDSLEELLNYSLDDALRCN